MALLEQRKQLRHPSASSMTQSYSWNSGPQGSDSTGFGSQPENTDPYPAWSFHHQNPISKEEIYDQFMYLKQVFGFQTDNVNNMFDFIMTLLDSRASRMEPSMALITLHADYIGGEHANFRKWLFCTQLYDDGSSPITGDNNKSTGTGSDDSITKKFDNIRNRWRRRMDRLSPSLKVQQIALYLLIWGECLTLRYTPEALCFIYKLSLDHLTNFSLENAANVEEGDILNRVITPLYNFIRDQSYEVINGKYFRREKDHSSTIGYDDLNEFFWTKESLNKIVLEDKKTKLMSLPFNERYSKLGEVAWKKAFKKTYYERRTTLHLLTNFSRIWIFHLVVYYLYLINNATFLWSKNADLKPSDEKVNDPNELPLHLSYLGLGGAIASILAILATVAEFFFLPRSWRVFRILSFRFVILFVFLLLCIVPFIFVKYFSKNYTLSLSLSIAQFVISTLISIGLILVPPSNLFKSNGKLEEFGGSQGLVNRTFTSNYPTLETRDRAVSVSLWALILICKLWESYFYIALSFKDTFKSLSIIVIPQCRDNLMGSFLCKNFGILTLAIMTIMDMLLFFLDTYFWYIVWNTIFSAFHSFYIGISILTPWRNIFSRLPKRIHTKILATAQMDVKYKPKFLTSQIWNSIVISMYREHLLNIEHLQRLLYQQVPSETEGKRTLKPPTFFVAQEDTTLKAEFFPPGSEAERRISFFAQSLSTILPEPVQVNQMPSFTVFTPHYSEKILLTLREIIREDDRHARVTLLEYLKSLHKFEWTNFVKDSKVMAEESMVYTEDAPPPPLESDSFKSSEKSRIDDLPYYCVGFKSANPEYVLRTRIWASLRAQTLYRTISGFMNYAKAIKILYRIENPEMVKSFGNSEKLERELDRMVQRKFKFLITMQRYMKFNPDERSDVNFLLRAFPDLQIAYLEEVEIEAEGEGKPSTMDYYSCLIDGRCDLDADGNRIPKYRIKLPGHPILGDGKADNQNHSIIFTRGEYVQLIDANQDNYLEEALKVRNILTEFEQFDIDPSISPYSSQPPDNLKSSPVAIVGAREYIFSENIGVLGDVAAGKEQTFGTMTQRIMGRVGGKLHYGHPDFLSTVFMYTRGGVSKAQKGLHLNEDIYAGINAFQRGGRIKHTEYYQCGKGRDLGFCSILNFNTKIGTGMGEQILSREQYYIGTQLSLDRLLTFYYAHPGFHVNNVMIMFAIQLFLLSLLCLGALSITLPICEEPLNEGADVDIIDDCFNIWPIYSWIKSTVIAIFVIFAISYLPLFVQVFTEQGFARTLVRLGKHFVSLSPLFEMFVNQIYSNAILTNLSFGGARYIATGRGFATTRVPFSILYGRFATSSLYTGFRFLLMILFASLTIWIPHLIYFWVLSFALCLSPFIFNPHQFSPVDFILDYRDFLIWLSSGNATSQKNSWVAHCRYMRTRITGVKRRRLGDPKRSLTNHIPRAHKLSILIPEIIVPIIMAFIVLMAYSYIGSSKFLDSNGPNRSHSVIRVLLIALGPIGLNAGILLILFPISLFMGPIIGVCWKQFGGVLAAIAHAWSVINLIVMFLFLLMLEYWSLSRTILGILTAIFIQRAIFQLLMSTLLTREFGDDATNVAWWTGRWIGKGMGVSAVYMMFREFLCKIVELSYFASDFILGHFILFMLAPFTLIPLVDRWHSTMLFWLRPSQQMRPPIYSQKQKSRRRRLFISYLFLFLLMLACLVGVIVIPILLGPKLPFKVQSIGFVKSYLL
ncbi:glycosyltransferase family 48 protein [Conidiobolus coronatus NRRL 28638]|uniref:1,3-beta-glucan synthase n=1 Tax=Conidiobolus coronatus (strain ATCC 28846 / CBS 209.66 / NRRL 28638) TaxID=796925 RepID=A0A137NQE1_CONC2|nr:glycosyltransferase family 48 protein [Conidiobolus coronatus NRRL 28638]|eukprot:KXN64983.1 glycosyltransferase family 48 protein [Conidiobolus coronatus NRRL 28638]